MKILVENGAYHTLNIGDLAMLEVALSRFKRLNSTVEFDVLTTAPDKLTRLYPDVYPLIIDGREIFFSSLLGSLYRLQLVKKVWSVLERKLRFEWRPVFKMLLRAKLAIKAKDISSVEEFLNRIEKADLVVATGGGYLTDAFKAHAISVLNLLDFATELGKPTVLLGQGLGPFSEPEVIKKAQQVLPKVDLIALREGITGPSILKELRVPSEKISITGDDAIELAYLARREEFGNGIGVNLRMANYSAVDTDLIEDIRNSIHRVAKEVAASLIPIPIETAAFGKSCQPDSVSICHLLQGYDATSDGGKSLYSPTQVIEQVRQCRVVVTGSYHAGVFALSQGIPVIGLAKSEYYVNKFLGLATQFKDGCEIILLTEPNFQEKLTKSIRRAWDLADQLRPQLLDAAEAQIELGTQVYEKVNRLVREQTNSL